MTTILLTGGTGFIGSHIAIELLQNNYQVIIVDNLSNSHSEVIEIIEQISGNKVKFYQCDINNGNHLDQVFQENNIDVVIHLAGYKAVGESVTDPLKYYDNNVGGLITLLKCMKNHDVEKIIFSSSATVYGNPKTLPLTENSETGALNPYGSTKLICENILKDMPGLSVIILRYFNPVGAHHSGLLQENPLAKASNLFPIIISVYQGKKEYLEVFGSNYPTKDGSAVRDYIHIVDLARGHVKSLDYILQNNLRYEVFNLGTGQGYSVFEIIRGFEHHSGKKLPFLLKDRRNGDVPSYYANCQKANEILGWTVQHNLDDMICSSLNIKINYKTTFVTAFYVVKDYNAPNKSVNNYFDHFTKLAATNIPIVLFISPQFEERIKEVMTKYPNVKLLGLIDVKDTWTYGQVDVNHIKLPTNRNLLKDSLEYMIAINTKIECVNKAIQANMFNTENFAWIDFGIFHVIKDINNTTTKLQKIANTAITSKAVILPGCWALSQRYDYVNQINWNFCGGFFIGQRDQLLDMWQRYQDFFPKFLKQYNTMVWEVNIWSAMVYETDWKPSWFHADHNDSIINIPTL